MFRKAALPFGVVAMAVFAVGCAITDYGGIPDHTTQAEAKLWGKEVAFSGFDPALDGTYSYTVKYGNTGNVTILSYRNPVFASFSRDGLVDRDGDDVQGNSGTLGGKFNNQFVSVDHDPAACGFFDNITQDKSGVGAGVALCITGFVEEIDKDLDLMDSFSSIGGLLTSIWSGSLASSFTLELTSIDINGVTYPLTSMFSMDLTHNGFRPNSLAADFSSPGGQALLQTILANTMHGVPVTLGVGFDGGMAFTLPGSLTVAFNHDALAAALQ